MITIYWAGDSTVKQNSIATWPQTGIGQEFDRFIPHARVHVANCAENGYSTRSYLEEGWLDRIRNDIRPGDYLFIQFGHNDEKLDDPARGTDPDTDFPRNLMIFARAALERGATPVFITPVTRRFRNNPKNKWTHDRWAEAVRALGRREGIAVIDLTAMSEQLIDSMTDEESASLYMNLAPGVFANYPDGQTDNTHLQPEGARRYGALIARGLLALGAPYSELVHPEAAGWLMKEQP